MKYVLFLLLLNLQTFAQALQSDDGFFDPARDPIATMRDGKLRLVVSEDILVRSVAVNFKRLGTVEKVERRLLENEWYLTLESRHANDIEQSVFVAVRLKPNEEGNYFADAWWTACTGEGCGSCGYEGRSNGCFCLFDKPGEPGTPGACYQTFSDEPLLSKVPLKFRN
ncbi:MAG: hypothetical protein JNJ57_00360 [Saprospiraceae bacterium]|nr:hypothetical protein [Saprospiraceae bacterium]